MDVLLAVPSWRELFPRPCTVVIVESSLVLLARLCIGVLALATSGLWLGRDASEICELV